jgi:mannobiose 2-epimerase
MERVFGEPAKRVLRPALHRARAARLKSGVRTRPASWSDIEKLSAPAVAGRAEPDDAEMVATLERLLFENMLPYWYPGVIDEVGGGYRGCDIGEQSESSHRKLMRQCRTLWFFARLARSPYGNDEFLDAARHGYEFLVERFLDEEFGGYHWAVDGEGRPVADHPQVGAALLVKDMCGQSFALYALSEFALASGSAEVESRARELFGVINERSRDRTHGGFHEMYSSDWGEIPRGLVVGADRDYKMFRTQAHLLEALAPYVELTGYPEARAALAELVSVATSKMIFSPVGVGVQVLSSAWEPVMADSRNVHNYGHDLELITFVHDAQRALGSDPVECDPTLRQLYANAVYRGMDRDLGGFALSGQVGRSANLRWKISWTQAEALRTSVDLYSLTGESTFGRVAMRTLDWIVDHQADWSTGEWREVVRSDGTSSANRGDQWNSPYHSGRAVLHSLDRLAVREHD